MAEQYAFQPRPGDWLRTQSSLPVGRVQQVDGNRMVVLGVQNRRLEIPCERIWCQVEGAWVLDCEAAGLGSLDR